MLESNLVEQIND